MPAASHLFSLLTDFFLLFFHALMIFHIESLCKVARVYIIFLLVTVVIVLGLYGANSNDNLFSPISLLLMLARTKMAESSRCLLISMLFGKYFYYRCFTVVSVTMKVVHVFHPC